MTYRIKYGSPDGRRSFYRPGYYATIAGSVLQDDDGQTRYFATHKAADIAARDAAERAAQIQHNVRSLFDV